MDFKVSVITPVYNAEKYIRRNVESSLSQPEVREVILVEDGSPDNALQVCKELVSGNKKVKLYQHPGGVNKGAGATRNLGISKANYPFIAFLDADDFYLPNRFKKTKEVFATFPTTDGVFEAIGAHFESEKVKKMYLNQNRPEITTINKPNIAPKKVFEELLVGNSWFSLDGFTIKREVVQNKILFDSELILSQDTDWIRRVAETTILRPGSIDIPVTLRGVHGDNRILNTKNTKLYSKLLQEKWFQKMKNSNWNKSLNWKFYVSYCKNKYSHIKSRWVRWPLVGIRIVFLLIKMPKMIKKFI